MSITIKQAVIFKGPNQLGIVRTSGAEPIVFINRKGANISGHFGSIVHLKLEHAFDVISRCMFSSGQMAFKKFPRRKSWFYRNFTY